MNINKEGAGRTVVREEEDGHVGVPAGAGGGDVNHESDGDGSKQTPGTPPDAVTPEVTTSSSQPVQSLAAEVAAAALLERKQPPA